MAFHSLGFLVFFLVVLLLHYLPLNWTIRKLNLLVASYVFYAAWYAPFLILVIFSTVVNFSLARGIDRAEGRVARRGLFVAGIVYNLAILGFFKYADFLTHNMAMAAQAVGLTWRVPALDIMVPLGISFYTFQSLSYLIDVHRRTIRASGSLLDYALYVCLFPQVAAGPILRAGHFLPQCQTPRRANRNQLGWGLALIVLGLFEKVVIADGLLSPAVTAIYDGTSEPAFVNAWVGTLALAGQIFCDFAGYSACAIGAALALGFALPDNFHFPYAAIGFSDFWRRWHISLSTWLRDYLYIPMGGNRQGTLRTYVNLMATMLLAGLWHGASWTMVVWGGLHGALLCGERMIRRRWSWDEQTMAGVWRVLLALVTFAAICFTWVFFRAGTVRRALAIAGSMLGHFAPERRPLLAPAQVVVVLLTVVGLLVLQWLVRNSTLEQVAARVPWWVRSIVVAALLVATVMMPGEDRAFIYFQF